MDLLAVMERIDEKISALVSTKEMLQKLASEYGDGTKPAAATGPVAEKAPAAIGRKARKKDPGGAKVKAQKILAFIASRDGCRSDEIAAALGFTRSCVGFHLTRLKRAKRIAMQGNSHNALWHSKAGIAEAPLAAVSTETAQPSQPDKPFACETCGKRFYVKGSLTEHILMHPTHGGK